MKCGQNSITMTQLSCLPYRVNALLEEYGRRTIGNKFLHSQELIFVASLEGLRF